jgi:hypothetical protein
MFHGNLQPFDKCSYTTLGRFRNKYGGCNFEESGTIVEGADFGLILV